MLIRVMEANDSFP